MTVVVCQTYPFGMKTYNNVTNISYDGVYYSITIENESGGAYYQFPVNNNRILITNAYIGGV